MNGRILRRELWRTSMNLIELKNITVARGGKKIFSGLNLEIPVGRNMAILGPNGAGKSTFLKLLTRELYPEANAKSSLKIFGESTWNIWELRSRIGIVSNDLQGMFSPDISGADVVRSGFFSSIGLCRDRILTPAQEKRVGDMLAVMGLGRIASRPFSTFSTGERRRFILARALVSKPEALVLDEPTAGLDLRASFFYICFLRTLMSKGTTVILVTHNINEIPPEMKYVALLEKGKILEMGRKQDVLTSEKLSALFDIPLRVSRENGFYGVVPA